MSEQLVAELRDKAKGYDLNFRAALERGDATSAIAFSAVACVLFELAATLEKVDLEEAA